MTNPGCDYLAQKEQCVAPATGIAVSHVSLGNMPEFTGSRWRYPAHFSEFGYLIVRQRRMAQPHTQWSDAF